MPRKKFARRFEPRYGVSREMLDLEATYVAREVEDYLVLSTDDLQKQLTQVRQLWSQADQVLEQAVAGLAERERLVAQCLIVRDAYHLLELYCTHLRVGDTAAPSPPAPPKPRAAARVAEERSSPPVKVLPFSEWLFGRQI